MDHTKWNSSLLAIIRHGMVDKWVKSMDIRQINWAQNKYLLEQYNTSFIDFVFMLDIIYLENT